MSNQPAVTLPPGEFMYKFMGLSGFSASRNSICATIDAEVLWSTSPFKQMMRSFSSREKISSLLGQFSSAEYRLGGKWSYTCARLLPDPSVFWSKHKRNSLAIIQLSL